MELLTEEMPKTYIMESQVQSITRYIERVFLNDKHREIARGSLVIYPRINYFKSEFVGLIEDIHTVEDYRRKGYATLIINKLIKKARERGCYKIVLICSDENTSLYERLGFQKYQNSMRMILKENSNVSDS